MGLSPSRLGEENEREERQAGGKEADQQPVVRPTELRQVGPRDRAAPPMRRPLIHQVCCHGAHLMPVSDTAERWMFRGDA